MAKRSKLNYTINGVKYSTISNLGKPDIKVTAKVEEEPLIHEQNGKIHLDKSNKEGHDSGLFNTSSILNAGSIFSLEPCCTIIQPRRDFRDKIKDTLIQVKEGSDGVILDVKVSPDNVTVVRNSNPVWLYKVDLNQKRGQIPYQKKPRRNEP